VILSQFEARVKLEPERNSLREDFNFAITKKCGKSAVL